MFLRRASVALSSSRRFFATTSSYDVTNAISEMNKEMESVFGMPPTSGLSGSINDEHTAAHEVTTESGALASAGGKRLQVEDSNFEFPDMNRKAPGLTHVGSTGEAQMVDVSPKDPTKRTAIASCKVLLGKHVYDMVSANQMAKGDVLTVAKIAGISGAKHTSNLIPLCHNIIITNVRVDLTLNPDDHSVRIKAEAASTGKTGVEMEALTAASVAGLTVYDMCKAASKDIQITDIRLERKTGGKSGDWSRKW